MTIGSGNISALGGDLINLNNNYSINGDNTIAYDPAFDNSNTFVVTLLSDAGLSNGDINGILGALTDASGLGLTGAVVDESNIGAAAESVQVSGGPDSTDPGSGGSGGTGVQPRIG